MRAKPIVAAIVLLTACPAADPGTAGDTEAGTASETGLMTIGDGGADAQPSTDGSSVGGSGDSGASSSADGSTTNGSASTSVATSEGTADSGSGDAGTGNDPGIPIDCSGTTYACGDGKDNDGDGRIDLFDPECTGPCDDDESSFATGIPGDNMDCKQDCFFDGNSGQGDDGCIWDLRCDPENPGANINCEYTGGNNCDNQPPNQDEGCLEFCIPFVPPGCDCFGCCAVPDGQGGEVTIFLNSHPDCALDNLGACETCTLSDDCVNTCDDCELCFGQVELPPDCDENECDFGDPCQDQSDCPTDWYCLGACCYPPPPG